MKIDSPDSVALADGAAAKTAAYVHIPFCRKICPYCDFAVVAGTELADRYVAALIDEIESADPAHVMAGASVLLGAVLERDRAAASA